MHCTPSAHGTSPGEHGFIEVVTLADVDTDAVVEAVTTRVVDAAFVGAAVGSVMSSWHHPKPYLVHNNIMKMTLSVMANR